MRCPNCGSSRTQSSYAVFQQGTSTWTSRSRGSWFSTRSWGISSGQSSGQRMSTVAAANQPPSSDGEAMIAAVVMLLVIFVGVAWVDSIGTFFLVGLLAMLAGGVTMAGLTNLTRESRAAEHERYARTWYCRQCGTRFEADLQQANGHLPSPLPAPNGWGLSDCRAVRAARVVNPMQRARLPTDRDLAGLQSIFDRSTGDPLTFDPCRPVPIDLGIMSRLASLGYLTYDAKDDSFRITPTGRNKLQGK